MDLINKDSLKIINEYADRIKLKQMEYYSKINMIINDPKLLAWEVEKDHDWYHGGKNLSDNSLWYRLYCIWETTCPTCKKRTSYETYYDNEVEECCAVSDHGCKECRFSVI